jgi:hypothetical protein
LIAYDERAVQRRTSRAAGPDGDTDLTAGTTRSCTCCTIGGDCALDGIPSQPTSSHPTPPLQT